MLNGNLTNYGVDAMNHVQELHSEKFGSQQSEQFEFFKQIELTFRRQVNKQHEQC